MIQRLIHTMAPTFDPYQEWLGVPPSQQPADHYRLLDIPRFESDASKIRAAADQRMQYVRTFQTGRRARESQTLLNVLAEAKTCLLNPSSKATYDASLKRGAAPPPVVPMSRPAPLSSQANDSAGDGLRLPMSGPAVADDTPAPPPPPRKKKSKSKSTAEVTPQEKESRGFPATLIAGAALLLLLALCGVVIGAIAYSRSGQTVKKPPVVKPPAPPVKPKTPVKKPAEPRATLFAGKQIELKPRAARLQGEVQLKNGAKGPALKGWGATESAATWRVNIEGRGYFKLLVVGNPVADGELLIELDGAVAGGVKRKRISFQADDASRKYITSFIFASPGGVMTVKAGNNGKDNDDALELNAIVLQRSRRQ